MKVIITLGIMLGCFLGLFLYFCLFSLFLKDDEKYFTIPYGFCFLGLIIALIGMFLSIYNSL